jgi:hypothetical protein
MVVHFSNTMVPSYKTTLCHVPEEAIFIRLARRILNLTKNIFLLNLWTYLQFPPFSTTNFILILKILPKRDEQFLIASMTANSKRLYIITKKLP